MGEKSGEGEEHLLLGRAGRWTGGINNDYGRHGAMCRRLQNCSESLRRSKQSLNGESSATSVVDTVEGSH